MREILIVVIVGAMSCSCTMVHCKKSSLLSRELPYDPAYMTSGGVTLKEARIFMDKTVYPRVAFSNMPTSDAEAGLVHNSSTYSPNPPWGQSISSLYDTDEHTTITLSGTNLSFAEILNAICEQSDRWWGFRESILMTYPDKSKPEFHRDTPCGAPLDEESCAADNAYRAIDKDLDALHDELKACERVFGKPLDKKIYAALNAAKQAVKRKDYQKSRTYYSQAIDLAKAHLVDRSAIEDYRRALDNIGRRLEHTGPCKEAWQELMALRTKETLRRIIIPELKFEPPATLIDAIDFFKQASRDYDDPKIPVDQRGVGLVLKLRANDSENRNGEDPFAVSSDSNNDIPVIQKLSARFISLYDALKLVCDVTGYQFSTRGGFVMITPLGDSEESKRLKKDLP